MRKELNDVVGVKGEICAASLLQKKKYKILSQNYKTRVGEIDIIAGQGDTIVFVEVKKRESLAFGRPCEAVNARKQAKIRRVAEEYLVRNNLLEKQVRFDVIEVLGNDVNHIQNAF